MQIIRREFLALSGLAVAAPSIATIALAQAQAGPKLTQILRKDLEGQGDVVQETVVSIVEFPPGAAAPWHMHPGAQELPHVIEGNLTVEIEGKGSTLLKAGEAGIIPAELVHLSAQRERERERQGAGRPQPGCKGQAADRGREEITAGVEARSRSRGKAAAEDFRWQAWR
jgi:quercetin dioxygenase-like cupin family protein